MWAPRLMRGGAVASVACVSKSTTAWCGALVGVRDVLGPAGVTSSARLNACSGNHYTARPPGCAAVFEAELNTERRLRTSTVMTMMRLVYNVIYRLLRKA